MNLLQAFQQFWEKHFYNLHPKGCYIIVAASGGLDSTVLIHLLHTLGYNFSIAHCNFNLRNEESQRDENFVQQLSNFYQVPCFIKNYNTAEIASKEKSTIQLTARSLRYKWFEELIKEFQLRKPDTAIFLATAHHLDDNIETVLMNVFKGTGISGLTGIPLTNDKIIRPLLFAFKNDLIDYARQNKLTWMDDSSNQTEKYQRNFFRLNIIPIIQKTIPSAMENMAGNIERWKQIEEIYQDAIIRKKKELCIFKNEEIYIPINKLLKEPGYETIIYEIIKPYSFTPLQTKQVSRLLNSESGSVVYSATHQIIKHRNHLILTRMNHDDSTIHLIEKNKRKIQISTGKLEMDFVPINKINIKNSCKVALLDGDKIQFPLVIRKWKEGDYFYPLGMNKKKKLSRFFIDEKLSLVEKEKTFVIEMNNKIIWVINHRIDDRFKITPNTKIVYRIKFKQVL